jgi:DNA primase
MQIHGVPCWATLGSARMHRVLIPHSVGELHLFGDNDAPGRAAVGRTAEEHRRCRVVLRFPPEQFKDWDDFTAALAAERGAQP